MPTLNVATKTNWDAAIPEWWDKAIMHDADRLSIISKLAGKDGSDAPVLEKSDLTKQAGDKITFTVLQRLVGKGQSGSNTLAGNEEKIVVGTHSVSIEYFRHATAANKIARAEVIFDYPSQAGQKISSWLARFLDDNLTDQVLNQDTIKALYAGGGSSRAGLGPGDVLLPHELRALHTAGRRRGVTPFRSLKTKSLPFPVFGALLSEVDYYNLSNDNDFRQDVRLGQVRGDGNSAITNYIDMYQGIVLWVWSAVNNGDRVVGSFLRPEGVLNGSHNSSTTSIVLGPSSAVANVDYAQYFPISGSSETLLINNEEMTYTPSASNPGDTTFSSVTRGANGTTAAAHSDGDLVTLRNLGKVLLFGQNFAMQAWAQRPGRIRHTEDYNFENGLGVDWLYEAKGVEAADGTLANAVVMETYSANPTTI